MTIQERVQEIRMCCKIAMDDCDRGHIASVEAMLGMASSKIEQLRRDFYAEKDAARAASEEAAKSVTLDYAEPNAADIAAAEEDSKRRDELTFSGELTA